MKMKENTPNQNPRERAGILDRPLPAVVVCLLAAYAAFTLTRAAFLITNWHIYAGTLSPAHTLGLFRAGLIFDTTAILYLNAPVILLLLLPLHRKERPLYYHIVRLLYVVLNMAGLGANLIDCVYFPFTGKRTTASVIQEFANEGAGGLGSIFAGQAARHWPLVVLFIILGVWMWKCFRPRPARARRPQGLLAYYCLRTVVFLAAIPLVVIAIRGGVGKSTRPITISNANEYANRPAETGIILNTPFSIMRTLKKTAPPSSSTPCTSRPTAWPSRHATWWSSYWRASASSTSDSTTARSEAARTGASRPSSTRSAPTPPSPGAIPTPTGARA